MMGCLCDKTSVLIHSENLLLTMNSNSSAHYCCIVTTTKVPSAVGPQVADAAQILDPKTGTILSAHGGSSTLKTGVGIGIQSFANIPLTSNNEYAYIANCGNNSDDLSAYLIVQGSSSSPKWKCRLPEQMDGGIVISPCGNFIIGAAKSGNCYCWATFQDGELLRVWSAHYRNIQAMTFSDCGSFLITGGADGIINVWSLMDIVSQDSESRTSHGTNNRDVNPIKTWSEHQLPITSLHTLPSSRIVSTSRDRQVVIVELFSGKTLAKIMMPSSINDVIADAMGQRLYMGSIDGTIYCIDIDAYAVSTTAESVKTILNSHNDVLDVRVPSFSGSLLEETILGMDVKSTEKSYQSELRGHEGAVTCLALLEEDGNLLVSGGDDGSIRVWDIRSRCCIRTMYPWSATASGKDGAKACPCSSITVIPRESIESRETDIFSGNSTRSKHDGNLVSLLKPLQRFPRSSDKKSDEVRFVTNIVRPLNRRILSKISTPSRPSVKRKRIENTSSQTLISAGQGFELSKENEKLKCELAEAKETIERWQKVNNKLAIKLKKAMA